MNEWTDWPEWYYNNTTHFTTLLHPVPSPNTQLSRIIHFNLLQLHGITLYVYYTALVLSSDFPDGWWWFWWISTDSPVSLLFIPSAHVWVWKTLDWHFPSESPNWSLLFSIGMTENESAELPFSIGMSEMESANNISIGMTGMEFTNNIFHRNNEMESAEL